MSTEFGHETASRLAELEVASRRAGLTARFAGMSADQRETADALVVLHGVDALVHEALRRHRPADPARFASAWIKAWLDLPAPTPAAAALCGRCDQGWLDEDMDGRGVKCPCHSARATVTA